MDTLQMQRTPQTPATIVTVGGARFGDGSYPVIAGPCAVESEAQTMTAARMVAEAGASMLRGGAFKPRTSPYSFQGLGLEGLDILRRAGRAVGLPTVAEVMETEQVATTAEKVDMLQVGSRNMQNFPLLRAVGRAGRPVLLKRGLAATIDEWLLAAEYVLAEGNRAVVLCERGIRTFETSTRNTLDISAIPVVKRLSHLPVIVDPSHAGGARYLVTPLALAGRAAGADGAMVEVHPDPDRALSDGPQQLDEGLFAEMMTALGVSSVRDDIDRIDREIVRLLAARRARSLEVGRAKSTRGLPLRSPDREERILEAIAAEARRHDLEPDDIRELFRTILAQSRRDQRRSLPVPPASPAVAGISR